MRTSHGGAGTSRRLVGEMFAARAGGLGRSGVATMTGMRTDGAPRISRRRGALTVAAGLLPVGALVGALWAWLAPPVKGAVALTHSGERLHEYLGSEADHFFVSAFLMLGMLNVVAAVAAVLAWQWRSHRGPGMVVGLCTGVVIAAGAAIGVGLLLAHLRYGTPNFAAA